ncbi:MAG: hypothetical protein M3525_07960 [Acidobacteriota bacterium]|nr:hypothetical protein [Acidobacteriota bacterium]
MLKPENQSAARKLRNRETTPNAVSGTMFQPTEFIKNQWQKAEIRRKLAG